MKKIIVNLSLAILLIICSFSSDIFKLEVKADSCDYENTCGDNDNTCKLNAAKQKQQCLNEQLESAKSNQTEYWQLASEWAKEAETLNTQIAQLQPQIEELNAKIVELENSISENETKVEDLNNRVLSRMAESQGNMHFSVWLDFLLGSDSFSDMLRRLYGIEAINAKEQADREELEDVIEELNNQKTELDASKIDLDNKMTDLQIAQEEAEYKQEQATIAYNEATEIVAEAQNALEETSRLISTIKLNIEDLNKLDPQSGFSSPVPGSTITGAFPYYYDGGGVHLGVDYAVSLGSAIYAPADGVIVIADDNCDTWGYLGNSCGGAGGGVSYGGNQLYFICSVNGTVYALTFSHLYSGSVHGTGVVTQGTQIGRAGSSGNSTGPHCHIEMFYLGEGENEDLVDYVEALNNGVYSKSFNCGWGSAALVNNCSNKGSAPCRLNGANYLPQG